MVVMVPTEITATMARKATKKRRRVVRERKNKWGLRMVDGGLENKKNSFYSTIVKRYKGAHYVEEIK